MQKMMGRVTAILALTAMLPALAESNDEAAIRRAALDYIEGWYTGDAARMKRALHPKLAKRMVFRDRETGESRLNHHDYAALVRGTSAGGGTSTPPTERRNEVRILDVYENAASVRIDASAWVDYLHLVRWNGEWKIVNVLWELAPTL